MGEGELRRVRETGHSLVPVRACENDGVPVLMNFERSVAQIGDGAVEYPSAASVGVGRMAAVTHEFAVEHFAMGDGFFAGSLLRRLRHRWYYVRRCGKRRRCAEFEGQ